MDKIDRQIELLHKSVDKWQEVVAGSIPIVGSSDCPLCVEYHKMGNCTGCPLFEQGEEFYCFNMKGIFQQFCDDKSRENAEEVLNMLEYMVDLYEIKKVHDNS